MSANLQVGQRVKWNEYVIRGKCDHWLRHGSYTVKSAARQYLDEAIGARGVILESKEDGYVVKFDGETHNCLSYLVEAAND